MTIWCYRKHQLQNLDVEIKESNTNYLFNNYIFIFWRRKKKTLSIWPIWARMQKFRQKRELYQTLSFSFRKTILICWWQLRIRLFRFLSGARQATLHFDWLSFFCLANHNTECWVWPLSNLIGRRDNVCKPVRRIGIYVLKEADKLFYFFCFCCLHLSLMVSPFMKQFWSFRIVKGLKIVKSLNFVYPLNRYTILHTSV